jgi:hypothetical protein
VPRVARKGSCAPPSHRHGARRWLTSLWCFQRGGLLEVLHEALDFDGFWWRKIHFIRKSGGFDPCFWRDFDERK